MHIGGLLQQSPQLWLALLLCTFGRPVLAAPLETKPPVAPATNAVTLIDVKGQVRIIRAGTGRIQAAAPGMRLELGDRLETGLNSRATMNWFGKAIVPLGEAGKFLVTPPRDPKKRPGFHLLQGILYFFHRDKPDEFEVQSPGGWAVILGTEFSMRVEGSGRTTINLFAGEVRMTGQSGAPLLLRGGEQGEVDPGEPPRKTSVVVAGTDLIQWFLYYPAVLDPAELVWAPGEEAAFQDSWDAYQAGDLPQALARYPADRQPATPMETVYLAALLLSGGQVDKTVALLATLEEASRSDEGLRRLVDALHQLIDAVQGRADGKAGPRPQAGASGRLAESYGWQARADLTNALTSARDAVAASPRCAFAWARVAELEFSFGRTRPAAAAVERALALAPRHAQAFALLGFLRAAQDQIAPARAAFEQAIALDGALGNAWLGRGLVRLRRGDAAGGREDLMTAAALEPQRALLRSYLGKAFANEGRSRDALRELELAQRLDDRDPTAWLYAALLLQQNNRVNEAVRALEHSSDLNDNRRVYRSRLLLEQDRAVRGANLAGVYLDAGLPDVSFREAARAVSADYANYSAHLFLADSYHQLRDPRQVNQRYETPWLSEFLLANLLAPVEAGALSQTVSAEEYSRLFERDRLGVVSSTEYFSNGDYHQSGAQFGRWRGFAYALDANYRSEVGQQRNNELDQLTLSLQAKQRVSAHDEVFLQLIHYRAEGGDLAQHYDPAQASPTLWFKETQEPILLGGWHHTWAPGLHTVLLAGRLQDRLTVTNNRAGGFPLIVEERNTNGAITTMQDVLLPLHYATEVEIYTVEAQQIWQQGGQTLIGGGRYQAGDYQTRSRLNNFFFIPTLASSVDPGFERIAAYGYYHRQVGDALLLLGGLTYDQIRYPQNTRFPPLESGEESTRRLSPKLGLVWTPAPWTTVRGAWTHSLGGASIDQSFQLEPSQMAGFSQTFRSVVPESAAGVLAGARVETRGLALDQRVGPGTYLGLSAEWLSALGNRSVGSATWTNIPFTFVSAEPSRERERLDYQERSIAVNLHQLIGREWSLGAGYRLSHAELRDHYVGIPAGITQLAGFARAADRRGLLHQLDLHALYQHESGLFAEAEALWLAQDNDGYAPALHNDAFWQVNIAAGYRFPRRHAEVRVGLLNANGQDYRLNPLNLTAQLPRERTFVASLRFNF